MKEPIRLSEEEFQELFTHYPKVRKGEAGDVLCPHCGNALSAANLAIYEGATEAGTGFTKAEIKCDVCHKIAWKGLSWYSGVESKEELIGVAEDILEEALR